MFRDALCRERDDLRTRLTTLERDLAEARAERDALQRSADLRWAADQRAIKRWQAEKPGRDLTWPDHADLCCWLLAHRDTALQEAAKECALVAAEWRATDLLSEPHKHIARGAAVGADECHSRILALAPPAAAPVKKSFDTPTCLEEK